MLRDETKFHRRETQKDSFLFVSFASMQVWEKRKNGCMMRLKLRASKVDHDIGVLGACVWPVDGVGCLADPCACAHRGFEQRVV